MEPLLGLVLGQSGYSMKLPWRMFLGTLSPGTQCGRDKHAINGPGRLAHLDASFLGECGKCLTYTDMSISTFGP